MDIAHWDNPMRDIPNGMMPNAHAIVIILKFAGSPGRACARAASAARGGIPILGANTWNYVVQEILACDKLYLWHHTLQNGQAKPASKVEPAKPTEDLTDQGVTEKVLWESFGESLIAAIKCLFTPGEKMDISEFLPILAKETGLSEKDTRRMLPHLAVAGIVDNPVGDTWRLLGAEGFTFDLEPAPKPEPTSESHKRAIIGLIKGLGPGPFKSKYAIESAMMSRKEFVNQAGEPMRRTLAYHCVRSAEEEGVVTFKDGAFWITPDPAVKLTLIPNGEQPSTKRVRREDLAGAHFKVSDDVRFLRSLVGVVERPDIPNVPPERTWDVIGGIKQAIPAAHWDKMAEGAYFAILRKKEVSPKPIPKEMFQPNEWDALAWETLKGFKMEVMAPFLKTCFYDEELKCPECGTFFPFTKADKGTHFARELLPPKRCAKCRTK